MLYWIWRDVDFSFTIQRRIADPRFTGEKTAMIATAIATKGDIDDIVDLFHRIDLHYFPDKAPAKKEISAYVRHNLFKEHCGVRVVLAKEGVKPLGIATFSILYPAPRTTGQLFMKDLFTVEEARGKGVGRALMRFLAKHALEMGCSRFDWTAETTNPGALEFYDRLGVPRIEEKIYYRLTGKKLASFAAERLRDR
jgi:GNAT superfamily N-acetyltransferase